jgi:predicted TIM-barrel fold metal-dependent hydrolase
MDNMVRGASVVGAIDCDIHPAVPTTQALLPYMDEYWRDQLSAVIVGVEGGIARMELNSYPPNAPLSARPDWRPEEGRAGSSLPALQDHVLDRFGISLAICNVLHGAQAVYSPYLGSALCRAINDWVRAEWLDRDKRLRASIVISMLDPALAIEEIERLAGDQRFVQVLVLAMGEMPLGRRVYWPIWEAAAKHGLPIGVHSGSTYRHPVTQNGHVAYLVEEYVTQAQGFASQVASFVAEGVFAKFPELKVVLIESGVSWLPAMMWRFSKDWRGVRNEVPWVNRMPAQIIRDHVRLTLQPLDAPPDAADVERLMEHLGSDRMLLFSSDYPHWQFDGDDVLPAGLPASSLQRILTENALETYPRLRLG